MKPELWAEIRRLRLVEGVSKREIARLLQVDRRTVQRALKRAHADEKAKRSRSSIVPSASPSLTARTSSSRRSGGLTLKRGA